MRVGDIDNAPVLPPDSTIAGFPIGCAVVLALGFALPLGWVCCTQLGLSTFVSWPVSLVAALLVVLGITVRYNLRIHCKHGTYGDWTGRQVCDVCESERHERRHQMEREAAEAERCKQEAQEIARREEALRLRELSYLKSIDPVQFERVVQETFRRQGWEVQATRVTNDRGVDAFLRMEGKLVILQCKRLSTGAVGSPVLRDLLGTIHAEQAQGGIVVTTTQFTVEAIRWHSSLPNPRLVVLVDGQKLIQMIHKAFPTGSLVPAEFVVVSSSIGRRRRRR